MDFFTIHLPIINQDFNLLLLLVLGFCVGTLGGFFGVGGAWIVTPALNIFGFPMAFAIGTDLAHIFGKSIIATHKHGRLGNVDWRLGAFSAVGSVLGVELGRRSITALEKIGQVGPVVRWVYMAFLLSVGLFMLIDNVRAWRRVRRGLVPAGHEQHAPSSLAMKVRTFRLWPNIRLPISGIDCISFWVLFVIFLVVGFLSGFLGVGGGFILLPALIYIVGCQTTVAVGSSLFCVMLTAAYGSFTYSLEGRTEIVAALVMLAGAAIGAHIGVMATRCVKGLGIRILFAVMIMVAECSVILKQIEWLSGIKSFQTAACWTVMGAAGGMTLLIIFFLMTRFKSVSKKT